jgi:hypothetical protein
MKYVAVDALRQGSSTNSLTEFHHALSERWTCPQCGISYEMFAAGGTGYSAEVASCVRSLAAALQAGCKGGHVDTHLRSSNGDSAVTLKY